MNPCRMKISKLQIVIFNSSAHIALIREDSEFKLGIFSIFLGLYLQNNHETVWIIFSWLSLT